MVRTRKKRTKFGLVGKQISYSFSKTYFQHKFETLGLENYSYENFDLDKIADLNELDMRYLKGFNVTIPYKEDIMAYLDEIDDEAAIIGAVNTVKIMSNKRIGYNTDAYGFKNAITPFLRKSHQKALILGTGGASKAIKFVFQSLDIPYLMVSRTPLDTQVSYKDLKQNYLQEYSIIVNCTPVGTFPDVNVCPDLDFGQINESHLLFDLIYNPPKTAFLLEGEKKGATIVNGLKMLEHQAEKSWKIWHE